MKLYSWDQFELRAHFNSLTMREKSIHEWLAMREWIYALNSCMVVKLGFPKSRWECQCRISGSCRIKNHGLGKPHQALALRARDLIGSRDHDFLILHSQRCGIDPFTKKGKGSQTIFRREFNCVIFQKFSARDTEKGRVRSQDDASVSVCGMAAASSPVALFGFSVNFSYLSVKFYQPLALKSSEIDPKII